MIDKKYSWFPNYMHNILIIASSVAVKFVRDVGKIEL